MNFINFNLNCFDAIDLDLIEVKVSGERDISKEIEDISKEIEKLRAELKNQQNS